MNSEKCLYVVAVPIGNLEEITLLGLRILRDTGVIFCEDTRVTRKLLNLLNIWNGQELIKCNSFNEAECLQQVMDKLKFQDCVLVSDAGYPVISDPGHFLIKKLRESNFQIQVINGPCAFIHAIVSSGIDSRKIFFAGFLTKKYLKRKQELSSLQLISYQSTIVYYESKNFIIKGLEILKEVYGDIEIGVCRELSKLNENYLYGRISYILEKLIFKGEFVVIIPKQTLPLGDFCSASLDEILEKIRCAISQQNIKLREACSLFKSDVFNAKQLYRYYLCKYKN